MSRFFKSALFPILIVVVLAFFAQRLIIGPGSPERKQTYADFVSQLQAGQVQSVDVRTKDNTLAVRLRDGRRYESGFLPDSADRLENRLEAAKAEGKLSDFNIEGTKSSGWL